MIGTIALAAFVVAYVLKLLCARAWGPRLHDWPQAVAFSLALASALARAALVGALAVVLWRHGP